MRIAVVAPSSRFTTPDQLAEVEDRVAAIAADYPGLHLFFHPQCRRATIHFAGRDEERRDALVAVANDADVDAIWFARGGYGSCRIALEALDRFDDRAAGAKTWLGYSDAGFLLAGLYRRGYPNVAHGPMPKDVLSGDGEAAVRRSLDWLVDRSPASLAGEVAPGLRHAAFNMMVLSMLLGTPLAPDLRDHVLMLEETDEHLYATDRAFFHIAGHLAGKGLAGIRLGRVAVKEDENGEVQPFDDTAQEIVERWCRDFGIPYLGRADIGHDSANKVVPFGLL